MFTPSGLTCSMCVWVVYIVVLEMCGVDSHVCVHPMIRCSAPSPSLLFSTLIHFLFPW